MRELIKEILIRRRLIKSTVFLSFMLSMVLLATYFARGEPVEAAKGVIGNVDFKAFSWGKMDKFKDHIKNDREDNVPKFSNFKIKFNYNNNELYVKGKTKPIYLDERCGGKNDKEGKTPYRYWFWVKANVKHISPITWRTDSYIATVKEVDGPNYDAKQYGQNSEMAAKVERLEAVPKTGSFFESYGNTVDGYRLDVYVIDIKEWYDNGGADADAFHDYLYLQSVIGVYHNGSFAKGPYYTLNSWKNAEGWRDSSDFYQHYNQYLKIDDDDGKHKLNFYRVVADKERPVYGHCNKKDRDGVLAKEEDKIIRNSSTYQLKDIKQYEKNGTTYYLKGIAIYKNGENIDNGDMPKSSFYILNNVKKDYIGPASDTETDEYSQLRKAGREHDNVSSAVYQGTMAFEFSGKSDKFERTAIEKGEGREGIKKTNAPGMTGKQDVKTLRNYMQKLWFKTGCEDEDIYLIYEEPDSANISVTAEYYNHKDDSNGSEMSDYESVDIKESKNIGKLTGTDHEFDLTVARKKEKLKILSSKDYKDVVYDKLSDAKKQEIDAKIESERALSNYSLYDGVVYTARSVIVEYTNTSGKQSFVYVGGNSDTKPATKNTSFDAAIEEASGGKFKTAIWSGANEEQGELLTTIAKAFDKIKITDMDKTEDVKIRVKYYQPQLQTMKLSYVRYKDKSGNTKSLLVGADKDDLKTTYHFNGNGTGSGLKFGDYDYDKEVSLYRNKENGEVYTEDGLIAIGVNLNSGGFNSKYEVAKFQLAEAFATKGGVKGYHSVKSDSWMKDGSGAEDVENLKGKEKKLLTSEFNETSGNIKFTTDFDASLAIGVYGESIPTGGGGGGAPYYIAHIHTGKTVGNPSLNPPFECFKDKSEIRWDNYDYEGKAKKLSDGSYTALFNMAQTLDFMGINVKQPAKYGFIRDYAECTKGLNNIVSGPTKEFNLTTLKMKQTIGDGTQSSSLIETPGYTTKMEWAAGETEVVEIDIYYLMYEKSGGTPEEDTPEYTTTTTEWNDIPNGMGTEFGGEGPFYFSEGDNCNITGIVDKDKLASGKSGVNAAGGFGGEEKQSVCDVQGDLRMGSDGNLVIPNGIMDWGGSGSYEPNELLSYVTATAYQSKGTMTKHESKDSKTIEFWWKVYYATGGPFGHTHSYYQNSVSITISWENIWCSLDKVAVWEADLAKMLNYAFPNSESGDKETIDADGDTRSMLQQKWGKGTKDYFVYLKRTMEKWRDGSFGEDECEWGIATNKYSEAVKAKAMPALKAYIEALPDTKFVGNYNCCMGRSASNAVEDAYAMAQGIANDGVAVYKADFATDVLTFVHPDFEDKVAGNVDEILKKEMNAIRTTLNGGRVVDHGDSTYEEMHALDITDLRIPESEMTKEDLFKVTGIKVNQSKLNSKDGMEGPERESRAAIRYTNLGIVIGGVNKPVDGWFYTDNINKVTLHTPISLNVTIERYAKNQVQNTRTFNTESNYDGGPIYDGDTPLAHDGEPLVLGAPFTIRLHYEGDFSNVSYGSWLDTEPYALEDDTAYFVFPYPVYVKDANGEVKYHEIGEEFKLYDVRKCIFYPAYWAREEAFDVDVQIEALNVIGQDNMEGIERRKDRVCSNRNICRDFYRVRFLKRCTVVGILTNLRITDVADYPYLERLFRLDEYKRTDFAIRSGSKSFNQYKYSGAESSTYPVVDGQTLGYLKYGVFKPGYKLRFNVDTIATMEDRNDEIQIEPTYYWVSKRPVLGAVNPAELVPVKVYYDENFGGTTQKLVEVGSALDLTNVHQLCIGDKENDAAIRDLIDTAELQGYAAPKDLIQMITDAWTYYHIVLPGNMRVNEGIKNSETLSWSYNYNWDGDDVRTKLEIPSTLVDTTRLNNCMQNWYGEYYLPDKIYVRLADSASDTAFAEDAVAGYDFKEDYWCNNGYLLVNFKVTSYKNGASHLTYNARDGEVQGDKQGYDPDYGDMWEIEDRTVSKTDSWLQKFNFREGDFVLFDLDSSMSDDYKSGGTH